MVIVVAQFSRNKLDSRDLFSFKYSRHAQGQWSSELHHEGQRKRPRLASQVAADYNEVTGRVDTVDRLRNICAVARRAENLICLSSIE